MRGDHVGGELADRRLARLHEAADRERDAVAVGNDLCQRLAALLDIAEILGEYGGFGLLLLHEERLNAPPFAPAPL
jgi:hypothetical protein